MDIQCTLCGRKRIGMEWDGNIPHNPDDVQEQIHELEHMQAEIRADESTILQLVENRSDLCPMCEQLMDGIHDETDEEELDTRITLQVAYLEDQLDRFLSKSM